MPTTTTVAGPLRYGIAAAAVTLILLLKLLGGSVVGEETPFLLFFGAVFVSSWLGGVGAGITATLLSAAAAAYFFLPRPATFVLGWQALVQTAVFVGEGTLFAWLTASLRKPERQEGSQRERLAVTLSSIGDGVIAADAQGRVRTLNPVAEALTGWKEAEAAGQPLATVFRIVNETTGLPVENPAERVLREGVVVGLANHTVLIAKDGTRRPIDDSAAPIRDSEGAVAGVVLTFRDVSERRRAEDRLRRSEQELADFFENAVVGLHWVGPDGTILRANRAELDLLGYTKEEYVGRNISEFHADRPVIDDILCRLQSGECLHGYEARLRCKDGSLKHVLISSNVLQENGRFVHTRCFTRDITERKGAEERLRASEARKSAILETALDGFITIDHEGKVVEFNSAAEKMFGFSREQAVGRELAELIIPPAFRDAHRKGLARHFATGGGRVLGKRLELTAVRANGDEFPVELAITQIPGGSFLFTGVIRDITERKRMEMLERDLRSRLERQVQERTAELMATEERFRLLVEGTKDYAIFMLDPEGRVASWNLGAERIKLYKADEIIGKHFSRFYPAADVRSGKPEKVLRTAVAEGVYNEEGWRVRKDGTAFMASVTITALRDDGGQIRGFSKVVRDITERKSAEENALRLARETAARGEAEKANKTKDEFLAVVSHELRTPLNAILGWATILRSGGVEPEEVRHGLEVIERNVKAQNQIIADLLDISRIVTGKLHLEMKPINLVGVIDAALETVRFPAEAKSLKLATELEPTAGLVVGDADRLRQVIANLLSNAVKFTPDGGTVSVRLERSGRHVRISVTDTGKGISPEFLPHVFERFRQADDNATIRRHGGLGLGLAIVRHLVELHKGTVRAESPGDGKGATFTVDLPPAAVADGTGGTGHQRGAAPARNALGGLRVLVVDDMDDARDVVATVLKLHGAETKSARSADEALDLLGVWRPDVLVSDIGMPGRDGYDLIRAVRAWDNRELADIPAAALTAFAGSEDRERAASAGFQVHIPKPVEPDQLVRVVGELARGKTV